MRTRIWRRHGGRSRNCRARRAHVALDVAFLGCFDPFGLEEWRSGVWFVYTMLAAMALGFVGAGVRYLYLVCTDQWDDLDDD